MINVLSSHRTDRAASAEPSLLELCRDALEEDESQSTEPTEIINSHTDLRFMGSAGAEKLNKSSTNLTELYLMVPQNQRSAL